MLRVSTAFLCLAILAFAKSEDHLNLKKEISNNQTVPLDGIFYLTLADGTKVTVGWKKSKAIDHQSNPLSFNQVPDFCILACARFLARFIVGVYENILAHRKQPQLYRFVHPTNCSHRRRRG
jgi:hypothetical protein